MQIDQENPSDLAQGCANLSVLADLAGYIFLDLERVLCHFWLCDPCAKSYCRSKWFRSFSIYFWRRPYFPRRCCAIYHWLENDVTLISSGYMSTWSRYWHEILASSVIINWTSSSSGQMHAIVIWQFLHVWGKPATLSSNPTPSTNPTIPFIFLIVPSPLHARLRHKPGPNRCSVRNPSSFDGPLLNRELSYDSIFYI